MLLRWENYKKDKQTLYKNNILLKNKYDKVIRKHKEAIY